MIWSNHDVPKLQAIRIYGVQEKKKMIHLSFRQPWSSQRTWIWVVQNPKVSLRSGQVAHQARAYPGFCSMKRLRVFLLPPPPGWDASPSQNPKVLVQNYFKDIQRPSYTIVCLCVCSLFLFLFFSFYNKFFTHDIFKETNKRSSGICKISCSAFDFWLLWIYLTAQCTCTTYMKKLTYIYLPTLLKWSDYLKKVQ